MKGRSETDGIAERAVRRLKEGASSVLVPSGLQENWWAEAMECYCFLRNVQDLLADGQTHYERRFSPPFESKIRSNIVRRPKPSASVGQKSPSW